MNSLATVLTFPHRWSVTKKCGAHDGNQALSGLGQFNWRESAGKCMATVEERSRNGDPHAKIAKTQPTQRQERYLIDVQFLYVVEQNIS